MSRFLILLSLALFCSSSSAAILKLISTGPGANVSVSVVKQSSDGEVYVRLSLPANFDKDLNALPMPDELFIYDGVPGMVEVQALQEAAAKLKMGISIERKLPGVSSIDGVAKLYPMVEEAQTDDMFSMLGLDPSMFKAPMYKAEEVLDRNGQIIRREYRAKLADIVGNRENAVAFSEGKLTLEFRSYAADDRKPGDMEPSYRIDKVDLELFQDFVGIESDSSKLMNSICAQALLGKS